MTEFECSVSPKGQITIPLVVRRRWGIKARDRVALLEDERTVTLVPVHSPVDESFGAVPPLDRPLTVEEMTEIAAEEHVHGAAREGVSST